MIIDIEKIARLTGFVDRLIQLKNIDNELDDDIIAGLIKQALMVSRAKYNAEEVEAAKRYINLKYQIKAEPGLSILADYDS